MITIRIDIPRGSRLLPKYLPPDGDLTEWAETGFTLTQLKFLQNRKWNFYLDLEPGEMATYLEMDVANDREILFANIIFGKTKVV
jgi:hypothetical protein